MRTILIPNKRLCSGTILSLVVGFFVLIQPVASRAGDSFFLLGAGGVKGIYFPVAERLCDLVNRRIRAHGHRCGMAATGGSGENIKGVLDGRFLFAIVQSNTILSDDGMDDMERIGVVATLHPEPIHVAVRKGEGFETIGDLANGIVNIGDVASGTRGLAKELLFAAGVEVPEEHQRFFDPSDQAIRLCQGDVDALIFVSGIRNSSMTEAHLRCDVRLLPVGPELAKTMSDRVPGLEPVTIPAGSYSEQEEPVESLGPVARIIAPVDAPGEIVQLMAKTVSGAYGSANDAHPALRELTEDSTSLLFPGERIHPALLVRPQMRPRK